MKKLYIALALLIMGTASTASAQNYKVVDHNGVQINGDTIDLYGGPLDEISYHAYVVNNSGSGVSLACRKTYIQQPGTSYSYFCWSIQCYPSSVYVSPDLESLNSGDTAKSFIGYGAPNGNPGTLLVRYTFFNNNDATDSTAIYLRYNFSGVGIEDNKTSYTLSNVYPNPANDVVNFDYEMSAGVNAEIQIFDLSGKKVKSVKLASVENHMKTDISALNSGVYFYSFVVNGKTVQTKRLIIAK